MCKCRGTITYEPSHCGRLKCSLSVHVCHIMHSAAETLSELACYCQYVMWAVTVSLLTAKQVNIGLIVFLYSRRKQVLTFMW